MGELRVEGNVWISEVRDTWRLALPLCLAESANQLLSIVDIAFIGRGSPGQIAGTSVGAGLFIVPLILGMGLMTGLDPFVAQALGAARPDEARRYLNVGLRCALVVSVPLMALPFLMSTALPWFGVGAETRREAWSYLVGRVPSTWAVLSVVVFRSYLQAQERGRVILIGVVVANVTNAIFDYLFVFGDDGLAHVGIPALGLGKGYGVFGVGLASSVAVAMQWLTLRSAVTSRGARPATATRREFVLVLRMGLPLGAQRLAEVGVFFLLGLVAGRMGPEQQSAHYVSMQVIATAFTLALGIAQAAAVRVGRSIGAGSLIAAQRAAWVALGLVTALMGGCGLAMQHVPTLILGLLAKPAAVIASGVALLHVAALFQIVDGIQVVAAGILRGATTTREVFWATLFTNWVVGLPVGLVLAFPFEMGVAGLWWGLVIAFTAASIVLTTLFVLRFRSLRREATYRLDLSSAAREQPTAAFAE